MPFFDFKRNETVFVTTLTGGNPALDADRRNVLKIGGNWQPFEKTDLRLRAEYVRQTIDRPQASFPAASEALEAAFPDRFERDTSDCPLPGPSCIGRLVSVDLTPVNFEQSRKDTLRWGFTFTKPLASKPPSEAARAAFRERFAQQRAEQGQPATPPPGESELLRQRRKAAADSVAAGALAAAGSAGGRAAA